MLILRSTANHIPMYHLDIGVISNWIRPAYIIEINACYEAQPIVGTSNFTNDFRSWSELRFALYVTPSHKEDLVWSSNLRVFLRGLG